MTQCTFKQGNYNCGSYAFNLYKEDIDQGSYCDRHYWQDQAQNARAAEREACKQIIRETPFSNWFQADVIEAIDKRGQA